MAESVDGELLLACPECNKAVALSYNKGNLYQGGVDLEEYRKCSCGNDMVDTERDAEGRIVVPQPIVDGSVTRARITDVRVARKAGA